nr:MurR/RpiR family transcriptional regulator [uncultured Lichenicoccus sp.]
MSQDVAGEDEAIDPGLADSQIPRDFKSLRALIVARRSLLPKRLIQVADFAVEHPQELAFGRVADLAVQAGVQPSTLVRFAQTLGYAGFSDLQAVFRAHARQRWPDYRERLQTLADDRAGAGAAAADPSILLHGFLHAARVSIDHLEQTIDQAALAQAVDVLAGARTICLLGVRRVYPVVVYLNYALRTLGARCELADHAGGMARRQVELLGADDAVLAVSFTPYASETLELARAAASAGIPVVAITDSPFSPLAQLAQVWMEVAETDLGGFRSLSATLALATALSVALMEQRAARDRP